jgi:lipooligosaccharide transport system ATP-binding protein
MVVGTRELSKKFGDRVAVDQVDLDIPSGVCFGVLGPNGAGKTTTLRMIYGVTQPTSGTIHVFGMDITKNLRAVRSRLGVTLQQNVLIEALSPKENLQVFGRYHLLHEPELSRRAEQLIDFLELRSHAEVPVRQLSGGVPAAVVDCALADQRAQTVDSRRAHHGARSRRASGLVVAGQGITRGRNDGSDDNALHGRGGAALR